MIYPIVLYGDPVLKRKGQVIPQNDEEVQQTIDDMFETMEGASGVGLAAPQIGKSIRLFIIDSTPTEDDPQSGVREAFLNPEILKRTGAPEGYEEGCLSIPGVREHVNRPTKIQIKYYDRNWKEHVKEFEGMQARIIQHEFDHIDGVLFTDYLSSFKKRLLKGKLSNISKGRTDAEYRVKAPARR